MFVAENVYKNIETVDRLVQIKSGRTVTPDYFKGTDYFLKLTSKLSSKPYVVHGGTENQQRATADVVSWNFLDELNVGFVICCFSGVHR